MNKALIVVLLVVVGFVALGVALTPSDTRDGVSRGHVVVHKSPTCGCCGVYASYLRREGYSVEVHDTDALGLKKRELGVPLELESCHTSEVGGYVVEGHVPNAAIAKLLAERPDIKGIGMAGMPSGSPGMPGPQSAPFAIYTIEHDGTQGELYVTL